MRRQGFTLVEMLVSLALVLFIMYILSQALITGLETFRQLKATGEMEERLRMASTILRQDLKLDHFEGRRRLSDPSFWAQGSPREGFFRIEQGLPSTREGVDGDSIPSFVATTHRLHFAIKLRGSQREDFLSASVPLGSPLLDGLPGSVDTTFFGYRGDARYQDPGSSTYNSQWAEVAYYLLPPNPQPFAGRTPLYALYRCQRLALPNNKDINWTKPILATLQTGYSAMSCKPNPAEPSKLYFNDPTDLTVPERRLGLSSQPLSTGDDLLMTDVVSFTVQVLSPDLDPNNFVDLPQSRPDQPLRVFDTWSSIH